MFYLQAALMLIGAIALAGGVLAALSSDEPGESDQDGVMNRNPTLSIPPAERLASGFIHLGA